MFCFAPNKHKIKILSGSLICLDVDTHILYSPGITWPDSQVIETDGPPVLWIEAGENIPPREFVLNGWNTIKEIQLEVVTSTEVGTSCGLTGGDCA